MAPRPQWHHTMQEARRQACLAIDFYNRPGDRRSYLDFVVHMHLAWQNLLHADRARRDEPILFREKNRRYVRNPDGTRKTWDLTECLKHEFSDADPVRQNIVFFIGLRNKIEHRFQDAFMATTGPHAHAYVINFESELIRRFGKPYSLADELRFPVFVQSLTPEGVEAQRKLRKNLPASARNYVTKFEAELDPAVLASPQFVYRVQLTPVKGPKSEADMAVTFVSARDLSDEEVAALKKDGKAGTVFVTEKQREVGLLDKMLPKAAAKAVEDQIPFEFRTNHFARTWKTLGVRPSGSSKTPDKTQAHYCIYVQAMSQYVYTPAYVQKLVELISTEAGYESTVGSKPRRKVTKLATGKKAANRTGASA
ncbi:MAG TPA: DUF3644 domain-containing protein [Nocardioides bacterium]|uniref:DUF3644 domain-containing protein n=1 Tax=uncultured Nocardioides sp. TaxID=198441 RepID=UPI000ED09A90|nr:DUF3644 domain-containing protein [uncultured Nocardioides sp.]HCB03179.1 DUF3644 domain-containing protein [Nocardioides sp.]HRK44629.1 DUF3644 domain-containing protein [Nocardioides sp.]